MFNKEEYEQNCINTKACFKKEIQSTHELVKNALGEDNEKCYQIVQMLRLIEYDFDAILDAQLQLFEQYKELEPALKQCLELAEEAKHRQEKQKEDLPKDVLSEIIRSVNQLDENNKIVALSYVRGMEDAYKETIKQNQKK